MKKMIALLLALSVVFALVGCSSTPTEETNTAEPTATAKLNIRIYPKSNFEVKDISFNLGLMAYYDEWESYDSVDYVSLTEDGHYDNSFKVSLKNGAAVSVITLQEPGYSPLLQDLKGSIIINE